MADTLVIVSESGKVYKVTLGSPSQSTELPATDPNAAAATYKASHGVLIAEIDPAVEQKSAAPGQATFTIMCTFVNLPGIGND
jgi:hypothetical protein